MDYLLQFLALHIIILIIAFFYFNQRLNAQDKYLTTYLQAFTNYSNSDDFIMPPPLNSTEILEDKEERKPEVYSPRHDQETIMQGKVIDPFD